MKEHQEPARRYHLFYMQCLPSNSVESYKQVGYEQLTFQTHHDAYEHAVQHKDFYKADYINIWPELF